MTKLCRARTWARFPVPGVVRLILAGLLLAGSGWAQYTITTVAGDGSLNYSGDNVPVTQTAVNPSALALDTFGNLYLADGAGGRSGGTIRKINTAGNYHHGCGRRHDGIRERPLPHNSAGN